MASSRTVTGKCSRCGVETDHDIVAMRSDGIGFCFGLECPACGKLVPEQAWVKYQQTGDVVVPNMRRNTLVSSKNGYFQKGTKEYK